MKEQELPQQNAELKKKLPEISTYPLEDLAGMTQFAKLIQSRDNCALFAPGGSEAFEIEYNTRDG